MYLMVTEIAGTKMRSTSFYFLCKSQCVKFYNRNLFSTVTAVRYEVVDR